MIQFRKQHLIVGGFRIKYKKFNLDNTYRHM